MDKIAKSRSKNKIKGNIPQLYLKPSKKESLELKPSKIPKKNKLSLALLLYFLSENNFAAAGLDFLA